MGELIATCKPALTGADVLRTIAPSIGIRDSYRLAVSAGKTPDLAYIWPAASVLSGYRVARRWNSTTRLSRCSWRNSSVPLR